MRYILLVSMLCTWFGLHLSTAQNYNFKQYSLEEGLPQSEIYALAEDQFGYLWIGTNGGGLCRFDGKSFDIYTIEDGLQDNIISGLHHDENYDLWIGTPKGIQKFDGEKFTSIIHSDTTYFADDISFAENNNGTLWCEARLKSGERVLYEIKNEKISNLYDRYSSIFNKGNGAFRIIPNNKGGMLIGSRDDLFLLKNDSIRPYRFNTDIEKNRLKYPLFVDNQGALWAMLFGEDEPKLVIHKQGKGIKNIKLPDYAKGKLIFDGYEDRNGQYWFILESGGLLNLNKKGWRLFNKENGLPINTIYKTLQDAEGNIWLGTLGAGLVRYGGDLFLSLDKNNGLTDNIIRSIFQDSKGKYYFGDGDGGINILNKGNLTTYPKNSLGDFSFIGDFFEQKNGDILLSTNTGLWKLKYGKITSVNSQFGWNRDIPLNDIKAQKDTVFISTMGFGLIKSINGKATFYNTYNSDILDNNIQDIFIDSKERIWLSSTRGITLYENGKFTQFTEGHELSSSYVLQAAEDKAGNIWFAAFTKGLIRYDNKNWSSFGESHGLSSNNIYSVLTDAKGNIWAGAQNGVDKIKIATSGEVVSVNNFDRHDGFVGIENNSGANLRDNNNNLWFGTVKGVMRYNPGEQKINYLPPPVYIRNIELANKQPDWKSETFNSSYDSIVPWFGIPDHLKLTKSQNNISFAFDALCYSVPEKVVFKWRLEPIESEWIEGKDNKVTYPSLPPGDYTFRVKAANNSGIWNDEGIFYNFSIHPAWYQTTIFRIILVLLFIGIAFLLIFVWNSKIRTLRFEMEMLVHSKTKELEKSKNEIEEKNTELESQKKKITDQAESISASLKDLEKLTDIGKNLTANLSGEKIFDLVYQATSEIMDTYLFGLGLFNAETNTLDFQNVNLSGERMPFITFPVDDLDRLSINCFVNDREIFIGDLEKEYKNFSKEVRPTPGDINSQSVIFIPIKVSDKPFGVLTVQSAETNAYTNYHLNFMRNIGIYTSIALENADAFEQVAKQKDSLEAANKSILNQKESIEIQRDNINELHKENLHLIALFTSELDNPLTSSLKLINSIKNGETISEKQCAKSLHQVSEALWQIKNMMNQVGEIKRLDQEGFQISTSPVPVLSLFQEVMSQFQADIDNKALTIKWNVDDIIVDTDYSILEKVISNLISNAINFSEENASIDLSAFNSAENVEIRIKDTGSGIAEEALKNVFSKFNQLSINSGDGKVLSGFGLYIVKRYIDGLGGDIKCESIVGIGTTFILHLPK
ncbi:sensor histidine kinase [Carboxylicivirga sp. N1Y90]|uniref:sensor histidine kinase n=1 Tax=Carboxylicivirga fragile TaxID=3417571 RepID=UPI003D32BB95|nr:hypothetical protein [Marinilabiliaceae bacterium N1Y90]